MCLKLVKGKQCRGKNTRGTSFCAKHQLKGPFDIEKLTLENEEKGPVVIYTDMEGIGGRIQIALMSLKKGEDIPMEEHKHVTQFVKVEEGKGYVVIDGKKWPIRSGFVFTISPNHRHRIVCNNKEGLKMYSIYSKDSQDTAWVH